MFKNIVTRTCEQSVWFQYPVAYPNLHSNSVLSLFQF